MEDDKKSKYMKIELVKIYIAWVQGEVVEAINALRKLSYTLEDWEEDK